MFEKYSLRLRRTFSSIICPSPPAVLKRICVGKVRFTSRLMSPILNKTRFRTIDSLVLHELFSKSVPPKMIIRSAVINWEILRQKTTFPIAINQSKWVLPLYNRVMNKSMARYHLKKDICSVGPYSCKRNRIVYMSTEFCLCIVNSQYRNATNKYFYFQRNTCKKGEQSVKTSHITELFLSICSLASHILV